VQALKTGVSLYEVETKHDDMERTFYFQKCPNCVASATGAMA
jgi:hypothetical protein